MKFSIVAIMFGLLTLGAIEANGPDIDPLDSFHVKTGINTLVCNDSATGTRFIVDKADVISHESPAKWLIASDHKVLPPEVRTCFVYKINPTIADINKLEGIEIRK